MAGGIPLWYLLRSMYGSPRGLFYVRVTTRSARRGREQAMKKKIRAIQYGVGPIGAALVRLMREKQAIELIGAIDTDPAKAGRDLGEVAGASDAPWGIRVSPDAGLLQEAADVVVHSTTSHLPAVADQLLACLAAESCV